MGRRGQSPTELVVNYFMTGDLVAVEQALVIARSIVTTRRERETSAALTAPARRTRVRVRKPAAAAPVVQTGTAPGATETAAATVTPHDPTLRTAGGTPQRRRSRAAAAPTSDAPKRKRGRPVGSTKPTGATPPMGTGTTTAATTAPPAAAEPPPLPDQGSPEDREDEPQPE